MLVRIDADRLRELIKEAYVDGFDDGQTECGGPEYATSVTQDRIEHLLKTARDKGGLIS